MTETLSPVLDDLDERPVAEVRCIYTGVPITSIPAWYAGVKVKFFSDASRKGTVSAVSPAELEAGRLIPDGETEEDGADLDADLELDDVELGLDDAEEAEPEAE